MTIKTLHDIGDTMVVDGKSHKVIGMHLYIGKDKQTERYYLGSGLWVTIKTAKKWGFLNERVKKLFSYRTKR